MAEQLDGEDWEARRTAMAARLGVHGDFIHVPQLARALDISSTTIHAQMRRGIFPMPHRKVGNVLVVKLDDYVRWFHGDGGAWANAAPAAAPAPVAAEPASCSHAPPEAPARKRGKAARSARLPSGESGADFAARVKREVLEGMRRKGFDV